MSRPVFDIEQDSEGWWIITRNGWPLAGIEFIFRSEAEAAVHKYEREDEEAEEEAREQDAYGDRADWEMDRDR